MDKEARRVFAKIAAAVRSAQQLHGVSDAELSKRSTIEPNALEQILSGEKEALPLHVVYLLAGALEVRPAQLMQGIEWVPDGDGGGKYRIDESSN
jgi:transcriptional regulator with XRE-family HTH domain